MDGVRPKMPTKLKGKAFRISEDDARSYRYASPLRANPGVTHIAAINGPGAYRRKVTARQAMEGARTVKERAERARSALPNSRSKKMATYYGPRPNPTPAQLAARKRFAEMARSGALKRNASTKKRQTRTQVMGGVGETIRGMPVRVIGSAKRASSVSAVRPTARGGYSPLRGATQRMAVPPRAATARAATARASQRRTTKVPAKQRSASMQKAIERAIKAIEAGRYPIGAGITAAVRAEAYRILGVSPARKAKRRTTKKRRTTPAAAGAKKGSTVARKKKTAKKAAAPKRRRRKSTKKTARKTAAKRITRKAKKGTKASRSAAARKAARTRKANKAKRSAAARKAAKTRKRKTKRPAAARKTRKAAPKRKRRKSTKKTTRRAVAAPRKTRKKSRRKSTAAMHAALRRKMGWRGEATLEREGWAPPRKRKSRKKSRKGSSRRRMRKNFAGSIVDALKVGGTITAGFVAHKALGHILNTIIFDRLLTPMVASAAAESATQTAATPAEATTEAAKAAEGVGEVAAVVRSAVGGGVTALAGIMLTNFLIRDQDTKALLAGGMVASYVHGLLVTALEALVPDVVPMLSGDGTSARLSAMMGVGGSIDPRYFPISGMGEYLMETPAAVEGVGEYFESGTAGLGNYTGNPDIYEAAAGYGAIYEAAAGYGSNHINPSSNLEHELTMAEAAAGVGVMPYEAAAGVGEYFEGPVAGLGAVASLPSVDTAIPGGALWAGVRSVNKSQGDTAMIPAGILETPGGAGILG